MPCWFWCCQHGDGDTTSKNDDEDQQFTGAHGVPGTVGNIARVPADPRFIEERPKHREVGTVPKVT